jgi:hypothetical protein
MIRQESYKPGDLLRADWQYTINHKTTDKFKKGDKVFLKSDPEFTFEVMTVLNDKVIVFHKTHPGGCVITHFPPQCLLQYKYAGLMTGKRIISISLN